MFIYLAYLISFNAFKNLFLVGGFGQSRYLEEQLKLALGRDLHSSRPGNSWTAVVRGAVLCGIEKVNIPNLSVATACRRYYGVCGDKIFVEHEYGADSREQNPFMNNDNLVKGQIHWILSKGDLILSNKPTEQKVSITVEFGESTKRSGKLPIYWYDDD